MLTVTISSLPDGCSVVLALSTTRVHNTRCLPSVVTVEEEKSLQYVSRQKHSTSKYLIRITCAGAS